MSLGHLRLKIGSLSGNTKKSCLTVHKLTYDEHLTQYSEVLKVARAEYYSLIIMMVLQIQARFLRLLTKLK